MSSKESLIVIPDNIKGLVEMLAKNVHQRWYEQRTSDGWVYGLSRNDELKTHPCLVPYEDLPEIEKEYDRITAIETLNTILSLGFKIERSTAKIVKSSSEGGQHGHEMSVTLDAQPDIDLSERFELAFNRVHDAMKKMVRHEGNLSFLYLLNELKHRFSLVSKYYIKLKQYAKLRNALVHETLHKSEYIAVPHVTVVEELESIALLFSSPPLALTIASTDVLYCHSEESVITVLNKITSYGCTSVPIYMDAAFVGLLTEDGIARWLSSKLATADTLVFTDVKVGEVLLHERKTNVTFVNTEANVTDIETIFEHIHISRNKIEAVIITESGSKNHYPLGIITSWDLLKIADL